PRADSVVEESQEPLSFQVRRTLPHPVPRVTRTTEAETSTSRPHDSRAPGPVLRGRDARRRGQKRNCPMDLLSRLVHISSRPSRSPGQPGRQRPVLKAREGRALPSGTLAAPGQNSEGAFLVFSPPIFLQKTDPSVPHQAHAEYHH